jgi:hypothetical protein
MKKHVPNYFILAILALMISVAASCKSRGSDSCDNAEISIYDEIENLMTEDFINDDVDDVVVDDVVVKAIYEEVKLLYTITSCNGFVKKFEYDNRNRIVKIHTYNGQGERVETQTLSYSGNNLVKYDFGLILNFRQTGNRVTGGWDRSTLESEVLASAQSGLTHTIDLNSEGLPIKYVMTNGFDLTVKNFTIQDGNIIRYSSQYSYSNPTYDQDIHYEEAMFVLELSHDNQKTPFANCATPKWWWLFYNESGNGNRNNVVDARSENIRIRDTYEFDSDGFPIKQTTIDGGTERYVIFSYIVVKRRVTL